MQFGYVDQGLSETAHLQRQFNINSYAPTVLVFKENADNPADILQVRPKERSGVFFILFFFLCDHANDKI